MSGIVISSLEELYGKRFLPTRRCQLDWERTSLEEYDFLPERDFMPKNGGETKRYNKPINIRKVVQHWRENEDSNLRFFMDGSRRTFRIADIACSSQFFPLVAGQVGVGVCRRDNRQLMVHGNFQLKFVLALPRRISSKGGSTEVRHQRFFSELCEKINTTLHQRYGEKGFHLDRILFYDDGELGDNYEDKAISVIQSYMIEQEKEAVRQLVQNGNFLGNDSWLVKDGSLEYAKLADQDDNFAFSKIRNNYQHVIGVSKSFNPELLTLKNNQVASRDIAELKEGYRTPAFRYKSKRADGEFAIWYLRLRNTSNSWGAFDGIVKIEKLLVTKSEIKNGVDSNLIDNISAWVFNERTPVCYGRDNRWRNHLYPIYLTEQFVKSRYLGTDHFIHLF